MTKPKETRWPSRHTGVARTNIASWATSAACVTIALGFTLACGGSASETPPPLEPDPAREARRSPGSDVPTPEHGEPSATTDVAPANGEEGEPGADDALAAPSNDTEPPEASAPATQAPGGEPPSGEPPATWGSSEH